MAIEDCYREFADGNRDAFVKIVEEFREKLICFINRYVDNYSLAEDLSEDVFVEVLMHPGRYNYKTSLKTYLFTIGRNKAIDYIRKNKRIFYGELDTDFAGVAESFEEKYCKEEVEKAMLRLLSELKEEYRIVLYLLYFEEMSYEEVGRIIHKSNKQVTNLAYRAKQTMREALRKEGFEYEE